MSISTDFFCRWDSTLSANVPSGLAPTSDNNIEVTADEYKFGGGSLHPIAKAGGSATIKWTDVFSAVSSDNGIISWWYMQKIRIFDFILDWTLSGGNLSRINITQTQLDAFIGQVTVDMYDNAGVLRVSTGALNYSGVNSQWQKFELKWAWNTPGGVTEAFIDEVSIGSNSGGETHSRSKSSSLARADLRLDTGGGGPNPHDRIYLDHFAFGDTPGDGRPTTLGAFLGLPNNLGH